MKISNKILEQAVSLASKARENSFVVWSKHKRGACLITKDGKLYGGCTIETYISGTGVCAERAAIDHAVINGKYKFTSLLLLDDGFEFPCGVCLQYLEIFSQIADDDIEIILAKPNGVHEVHTLLELLPYGYRTKHHLDVIDFYKYKVENDASLIE